MDLFRRATAVRLKSRHEKYLCADDDEMHVIQDRNGSSPNARWHVEFVAGDDDAEPKFIRFRSCYGRYLTASSELFLLGATGRKVIQSTLSPGAAAAAVEWEPVRDGFQVRLLTKSGQYLRANGFVPPWRNSVTHDIPHRASSQDVLWDIEIVQVAAAAPPAKNSVDSPAVAGHRHSASVGSLYVTPPLPPAAKSRSDLSEDQSSSAAESPTFVAKPLAPPPGLNKLESTDSFAALRHKVEGRAIHYHVADTNGNVNDGDDASFTFNGTNLEDLTRRLEEESGLSDIIVCSHSPLDGKLHPLHLHLPPNNTPIHVVLVKESSRVARTFPWPYGSS